jgi:hypothetical protein
MRIHNDFTLYWRMLPSGRRVVYYYAYDENGKRRGGLSTGKDTKTAATGGKKKEPEKTGAAPGPKNRRLGTQ